MEASDPKQRLDEVTEELRELERSIDATRTHGLLYYALLIAIMLVAISIGHAVGTLTGIAIAAVGFALVAYREVHHYRERTNAIGTLIAEKRHEKQSLEQKLRSV